jgi:predicted heme/steroid binding protein
LKLEIRNRIFLLKKRLPGYCRTILAVVFIINFANVNAQYNNNEFPAIGTNFIMAVSQVHPQKKLDIRDLGSNVWDLSMFNPTSFDTLRIMQKKKTRYGKRFPEADVAVVTNPVDIEYLIIDSGKVYLAGLIGDFMEKKLPVLLRFKDKLLYKNPHLRLNEHYSDTSDTYFVSPYFHHPGTDSIKADIEYIRTGRVDAAGKLITPLGEYQVDREVIFIEKRVRGYKHSMFGWTPAPEYSLNKHFTMYRWYTKDNKLPVAEAFLNMDDKIEYIRYQYDSPLRLAFTGEHVNCKGASNGMVDLTVTGGIPDYSYKWTNGAITQDLKNVKAGTYRVVVTDNRGRAISSYYTVTEPLIALQANLNVKHVSCRGKKDGRIKLEIKGGKTPYDFIWSNDSVNEIITGLGPGKTYVKVTDAGGCVIIDSVEITQPEYKLKADFKVNHVSCYNGNNGTATLFAEGGTAPYLFQWTDNDTSRIKHGLNAGKHLVTVFDKNNCSITKEVVIKQPDSPIKIIGKVKPVSCYGGSDGKIELDVSGGKPPYNYLWPDSSESKNLMGITAGKYELTLTDKNECVVKETVEVTQPESGITTSFTKKDVSCFDGNDGEVQVLASGGTPGYNYQWENGQTKDELKKLKQGSYIVKITDKKQCFVLDTIEITAPEQPLTVDFVKYDVKCHKGGDGSIQLIVEGGTPEYSYSWSNKANQRDINGLKAGKYAVIVTDSKLCKLKKEFEITEPQTAIEVSVEKIDVNCYGEKSGSIYLSVKGGVPDYTYKWSDGNDAPSILGIGAGKYEVEIEDSRQCKKKEIIELVEPQKLSIEPKITMPDLEKENGSIAIEIIGGSKPYHIVWDDGTQELVHKNIGTGHHDVQVTDSKGCTVVKNFELDGKIGN